MEFLPRSDEAGWDKPDETARKSWIAPACVPPTHTTQRPLESMHATPDSLSFRKAATVYIVHNTCATCPISSGPLVPGPPQAVRELLFLGRNLEMMLQMPERLKRARLSRFKPACR